MVSLSLSHFRSFPVHTSRSVLPRNVRAIGKVYAASTHSVAESKRKDKNGKNVDLNSIQMTIIAASVVAARPAGESALSGLCVHKCDWNNRKWCDYLLLHFATELNHYGFFCFYSAISNPMKIELFVIFFCSVISLRLVISDYIYFLYYSVLTAFAAMPSTSERSANDNNM